MLRTSEHSVETIEAVSACRIAAAAWARQPICARLAIVRRARRLIARHPRVAAATVGLRSVRDTMVCEVLPLLDAMRFLERRAERLLAVKKFRRGRPLWLSGVSAEIRREPLGVILVLGPANYPLFLPCIQAIQALVAGNGVCLKPAPGGEEAASLVAMMLEEAGLPTDVVRILDARSGSHAVKCGFDRIILTGSSETGIKVLQAAAAQLTPSTLELSGCDAAYVMQGADLTLVARCLAYGLSLNGGATCIAPRRVYVLRAVADELERSLVALLPSIPARRLTPVIARQLDALLEQASSAGARIVRRGQDAPVIVAEAASPMELLRRDIPAPWLAIIPIRDMADALAQSVQCPYALGASIFGPAGAARQLARDVRAGSICINDVIVPTADPRLPFGGSGRSGYGRTRGADGLMEMTAAKCVSVRKGRFMPHLAAAHPGDEARFAKLISFLHGGWGAP